MEPSAQSKGVHTCEWFNQSVAQRREPLAHYPTLKRSRLPPTTHINRLIVFGINDLKCRHEQQLSEKKVGDSRSGCLQIGRRMRRNASYGKLGVSMGKIALDGMKNGMLPTSGDLTPPIWSNLHLFKACDERG